MLSTCRGLLLVASALLVHAKYHQRCTEVTAGELSGIDISPAPERVPPWKRRHVTTFTSPFECKSHGIALFVCDVVAPQVELDDNLTQASILRLGPLWPPLLIQSTHYCEPADPPRNNTDSPIHHIDRSTTEPTAPPFKKSNSYLI